MYRIRIQMWWLWQSNKICALCSTHEENNNSVLCKGMWDDLNCWPAASLGQTVTQPCPEFFNSAGEIQTRAHPRRQRSTRATKPHVREHHKHQGSALPRSSNKQPEDLIAVLQVRCNATARPAAGPTRSSHTRTRAATRSTRRSTFLERLVVSNAQLIE